MRGPNNLTEQQVGERLLIIIPKMAPVTVRNLRRCFSRKQRKVVDAWITGFVLADRVKLSGSGTRSSPRLVSLA